MKLPRNLNIWLPGYLRSMRRPAVDAGRAVRVFVAIADHYEPLRGKADLKTGQARVEKWQKYWPEIARRHCDAAGRVPKYTFFYPEDEYEPELLEQVAEIVRAGYGDVEIHIHHDGEGEQNFIDRMAEFKENLYERHGLLRKDSAGRIVFGFIHGNWALDNSLPSGRYCGLNNEITLLKDLGCYADFTMPSAPQESQARLVNTIYWAVDDPVKPKSYDSGTLFAPGGAAGDLLMIPGPLALNWRERSHGIMPRIEVGELAAHNPVTRERVRLWLEHAPRIGNDIFIKLFAHGALEVNAEALLGGDLDRAFAYLKAAVGLRHWQLHFVSAAEMARAACPELRTWESLKPSYCR